MRESGKILVMHRGAKTDVRIWFMLKLLMHVLLLEVLLDYHSLCLVVPVLDLPESVSVSYHLSQIKTTNLLHDHIQINRVAVEILHFISMQDLSTLHSIPSTSKQVADIHSCDVTLVGKQIGGDDHICKMAFLRTTVVAIEY